ncbi:putative ToxD-like zinc binding oxidoreductase [Aspergillus keveii]|uniref:ToxD-like zinc binding oxidoreductase n=1 Tax=Aspergillus keveii TaxID=714993 RepID=A0ABR4FRF3_9EURO
MKAIIAKRTLPKRLLSFALHRQLGQGATITEIPIPEITPDEILVKVSAVALNPIDTKGIDVVSPWGSLVGCDYAGTVTKVGKNASNRWKVGERVAGFVHGGQYKDVGSFAEYLKVDAGLAWKVPEGVTDVQASTFGIAAVTAVLALEYLDVPLDDIVKGSNVPGKESTVFVYSGASNVGLFAIQLAKRAGLKVVTAASPRSFDLVKRYGADDVFDYRSPTAVEDIKNAYPNIRRAIDCFSEGGSAAFCANVLASGKVITLLDQGKPTKPGVEYKFLMVFTAFGEKFQMLAPLGPVFPVTSADGEVLARFYSSLPALLGGAIKPPAITVIQGGLEELLKGLDTLRKGEARGSKLVVEFQ